MELKDSGCIVKTITMGVDFNEKVPFSGNVDDPVTIGFNGKFLAAMLDAVRGEGIEIKYKSAVAPVQVDNDSFHCIFMPTRIKNATEQQ